MFSCRRWLQIIIDSLNGAEEVLDDSELDALFRAVEVEIHKRRING